MSIVLEQKNENSYSAAGTYKIAAEIAFANMKPASRFIYSGQGGLLSHEI